MKNILLLIGALFLVNGVIAQNYTSYFTGNQTDLVVAPTFGVCLMGGSLENDESMKWFLERANGGDVLVLRASGSDGYNDYFYSELGITINSVESIVIENEAGALDPYVLDKVASAEAIWFAGGNQFNYINYFKDNAMEVALQNHISVKQGVIGGTSAGMAILGEYYFDAENGTVTSQQAIGNPYLNRVSIGGSDFLDIPFLENVITDTHYDDPDRRGRHTAFMARIIQDNNVRALGLASEERTTICIDENGIARAYGSFPSGQDFVYFVQPACEDFNPDQCQPGQPLLWQDGVRAFKVPATNEGVIAMDMNTWEPLTETGEWVQWNVEDGDNNINAVGSENPDCFNLSVEDQMVASFSVFPNPTEDFINISGTDSQVQYTIYNIQGTLLSEGVYSTSPISVASLAAGVYFIEVKNETTASFIRFVKR